MDTHVNDFIDFKGLFEALYLEHEGDLGLFKFEADHYRQIINFKNSPEYEKCEIEKMDCELKQEIVFVFGLDANNANESNNQSDFSLFIIQFNQVLDEFTSFYSE